MFQNKKVLVITIFILLVLIIVAFFLIFRNPISIIESKIHIKLPSNAKVINHEYHIIDGYFSAKLEIDIDDVASIQRELMKYFKEENMKRSFL